MKNLRNGLLFLSILYLNVSAQDFWQKSKFPDAFSSVSSILCEDKVVLVGTKKYGLYKSTDNGDTFSKVEPGLPSDFFSITNLSITVNGYLFAIDGGPVYRSTDNGTIWTPYDQPGVLYNLTPYTLCSMRSFIYAGGAEYWDAFLARSTDNGNTWAEILNVYGDPNTVSYNIISIAIDSSGILLGCRENKKTMEHRSPTYQYYEYSYNVIRSTDYGLKWSNINFNFETTPKVYDFAWNSHSEVFAASSQGLLFSADSGITWTQLNGLPTNNIRCIAINILDTIFVGTGNAGIFLSSDNGSSWNALNEGITDSIINVLELSKEGFLFAGTEHNGIFRSKVSTAPIKEIPVPLPLVNIFNLCQNYPNPFNPTTTIKYQIPRTEFVSLKIYDLLGREVATLVNEEKLAGIYDYQFSNENFQLPSGVYFYRLQAGSFSDTKKLIIMK